MSRMRTRAKAIRYAISGVLAAGLLAGCAGSSHLARAGDHAVRSTGKLNRVVEAAERAVQKTPNDTAARIALAQAYLDAGRFQAAATTFNDAVQLGDTSGRTALSLALANIGAGDTRTAVSVLDGGRDTIPATDRGLAMALAGETNRGVAILTDALRAGENTAKLRQNLAYAFALDGRWREARVTMAQDVPADQIDDRISEWASAAQPEFVQKRVASLLGVPAGVADSGQPQALALNASAQPALAAVDAAPVAPPAAAELPPVDPVSAPTAPMVQTALTPTVAAPAAAPPSTADFVAAFSPSAPVVAVKPAARKIPASVFDAPRAAASHARSGGTHLVQLGSFSSEANARRAWRIYTVRNPQLRGYQLTITPAVVNGRNFWRVAAAGFNGNSARRLCSGLRDHGNACFAYAANRASAFAKPAFALAGTAKSRR